nr:hypothetical protein [Romboutsia ilealis]
MIKEKHQESGHDQPGDRFTYSDPQIAEGRDKQKGSTDLYEHFDNAGNDGDHFSSDPL